MSCPPAAKERHAPAPAPGQAAEDRGLEGRAAARQSPGRVPAPGLGLGRLERPDRARLGERHPHPRSTGHRRAREPPGAPPREPALKGALAPRSRPASRAVPAPARPPSGSSARPARPARALSAATGGAAGATPRSSAPGRAKPPQRQRPPAELGPAAGPPGLRHFPSGRGPERGAGGGGSLTGPCGPSGAGRGRSVPSRRGSPPPALPAPPESPALACRGEGGPRRKRRVGIFH